MAMSLVQDGSGYPYFAECVHMYLQGVSVMKLKVEIEDVSDYEVQSFLKEVCSFI